MLEELRCRIGDLSLLQQPPERQFLNFAWPCLENRVARGKEVLTDHVAEIEELIRNSERPRRSMLRFVCPDAYRGIRKAAASIECEPWSQMAVEQYFILDHNQHAAEALAHGVPSKVVDLCMVNMATITAFRHSVWETVRTTSGSKGWVVNPLSLPLKARMLVAMHGRVAVDILRPDILARSRLKETDYDGE